jgi:DNA-binding IclR family transcriptional regulator
MHTLTERILLTRHLAILEQNEAVGEPSGVYKLATWLGEWMDPHCTSLGKALLGHQSDDEIARTVRKTRTPRHNDNSIATSRRLRKERSLAHDLVRAVRMMRR